MATLKTGFPGLETDNSITKFLRGDGTWNVPSGSIPLCAPAGLVVKSVIPPSTTKLLLLGQNDDEAVTTLDGSYLIQAMATIGTAKIDTAQVKFGRSSMWFDGNSDDFYTTNASAANNFSSNSWYVKGWFRFENLPVNGAYGGFFLAYMGVNDWVSVNLYNNAGTYEIRLLNYTTGVSRLSCDKAIPLIVDTWHYIEVTRSGNDYYIWCDGVQCGTTVTDADACAATTALYVGVSYIAGPTARWMDGWISDFEVGIGTAGHIAPYSVPTAQPNCLHNAVQVTADSITLLDSATGYVVEHRAVNVTTNISVSGLGGLDASDAYDDDAWYYVILVSNGTTINVMLSKTNDTIGTVPGGYTYQRTVSVVRMDGTWNFLPYIQDSNLYKYTSYYLLGSGLTNTSVTAIDLSSYIPLEAPMMFILAYSNAVSSYGAAVAGYVLSLPNSTKPHSFVYGVYYTPGPTWYAIQSNDILIPLVSSVTYSKEIYYYITSSNMTLNLYANGFIFPV